MKKTYKLGGFTFESQKDLVTYLQNLLHSTGIGEPIMKDRALLTDLLELHPSAKVKKGVGVNYFTVNTAPGGGRCFWIVRENGTQTDFSYKKCLTPHNRSAWLTGVFRAEVNAQVRTFKDEELERLGLIPKFDSGDVLDALEAWDKKFTCPLLKIEVPLNEVEVDHQNPDTFKVLLTRFLKTECVTLEEVEAVSTNMCRPALRDRKFAQRWYAFHLVNAKLRLVSRKANLMMRHGKLVTL